MPNVKITFQPKCGSRVLCQMWRSRSNLRREPQLICGPQPVQRPISDSDLASNCKHRSQPESPSNLKRGFHQQYGARIAFCAKRNSRSALQYADLRVMFQHQNASLRSFLLQFQYKPMSSAFQHRREPVSSASQHQSKVRVQRETRVSAVTDSCELGQLHHIFSPHNGE